MNTIKNYHGSVGYWTELVWITGVRVQKGVIKLRWTQNEKHVLTEHDSRHFSKYFSTMVNSSKNSILNWVIKLNPTELLMKLWKCKLCFCSQEKCLKLIF